jgi:uncharacterized membrane protein
LYTTNDELCLELRPNCSLTQATALLFFGFVCLTSFGIATLMAVQGFWPVLPFAGLEMLVLGWALRVSLRNAHVVQRLAVSADTVRVDCTGTRSEEHLIFPRHWAKVTLRAPYTALHPSRLLIESRGRTVEIGGFLTEDERRGLAAQLKQMIGTINESPPLDGRTAAQAR